MKNEATVKMIIYVFILLIFYDTPRRKRVVITHLLCIPRFVAEADVWNVNICFPFGKSNMHSRNGI